MEIEQEESGKTSENSSINKNENNKPSGIGTYSGKEDESKQNPAGTIKSVIVISLPLMALLIDLGVKKRA